MQTLFLQLNGVIDGKAVVHNKRDGYSSFDTFGNLPSYGTYLRDAESVHFPEFIFKTCSPDARPALRWENTKGLRLDSVQDTGLATPK